MCADKYITKVTGKYNLINWDYQCPECDHCEDVTIDMREKPEGYNIDDEVVLCPKDGKRMHRIWKRAPAVFIGGDNSDRRIALMRKSFRERFTKGPGIDDTRHKHGRLYDDSIRSQAAARIKKEVEKE